MSNEAKPIMQETSVAEMANAIRVAITTRTPHVFLSFPGLGKTSIVRQTANEMNYQYAEAVLGGRDIGSVFMPYIVDGGLKHHYNPIFPIVGNPMYAPDRPVVLNFDEIDKANRLMQSVLLKALDEWKIGEAPLRDDVVIVATGNRVHDLAGTEQFNAALANRATILHLSLDVDFWLAHAMTHNFHPLTMAWVRSDYTNLYDFDPKAYMAGDFAFPSPRSNEKLSRIQHAYDQGLMSERLFKGEVCGTIGQARGIKYTGFIKIQKDLPDIEAILQGKSQPVPENPAIVYAVLAALVQRADPKNLSYINKYMEKLSAEWHLVYTKSLGTSKPYLMSEEPWSKWLAEHASTLI